MIHAPPDRLARPFNLETTQRPSVVHSIEDDNRHSQTQEDKNNRK